MIDQIFHRDAIPPMPWKNGGGVTRQIAMSQSENPFWRISIADVEQNGAFSKFDGLNRILTVTEGKGMTLSMPDGDIAARLNIPVRFSGDTPVTGMLTDGPIQDFNLIYDAMAYVGNVWVGDPNEMTMPDKTILTSYFCLSGRLGPLTAHSGVLNPSSPLCNTSQTPCVVLAVSLSLKT